MHQVGAAKVVQTALREDLSTCLEPHRLTKRRPVYLANNSGVKVFLYTVVVTMQGLENIWISGGLPVPMGG